MKITAAEIKSARAKADRILIKRKGLSRSVLTEAIAHGSVGRRKGILGIAYNYINILALSDSRRGYAKRRSDGPSDRQIIAFESKARRHARILGLAGPSAESDISDAVDGFVQSWVDDYANDHE